MSYFLFNGKSWNKEESFVAANNICLDFLKYNSLNDPKTILNGQIEHFKRSKWTNYGWYDFTDEILYVNLKKSRPPVKTPGFSWSYPCNKSDLTVVGITAHEYGHHIHNCLNNKEIISDKELFKVLRSIKKVEKPVSGYEPNSFEMMAEMLRLFILNPSLLQEGRPIRWTLLTDGLKLKPLHSLHWKKILKNSHKKIIDSNINWIKSK